MTHFADTDAGQTFIASANSRETSREIMAAIAFHARNIEEAEALWNGDGFGVICHPSDLWETITGNGNYDAEDFVWGASGSNWWAHIQAAF